MVNEQCRAITRSGNRCSNKAKIAGFCGHHLPLPRSSSITEKLKHATQIAILGGSYIGLIEKLVNLWQSLPFGPGPIMPHDYKYLINNIGPTWPELPHSIPAFTKGEGSINWSLARQIYDIAYWIIDTSDNESIVESKLIEIDSSTKHLIDTMQPELRELFLQKIGSTENN